jgi:ATP-dependent helicase/nuclease subunit A
VHDQLDRIYFEADVLERYRQAAPEAMRGAVQANLQAFIQRALDTDSGRYPSLQRFLHELADLREAPAEEAPDEGIVGDAGNAVRIYTVHGAKGLESPVVWLLDAASPADSGRGYDAVIEWPPEDAAPRSFSLSTVKNESSTAQQAIVDKEKELAEREELNLLYVAMTRAQQAFIVSGAEIRDRKPGSWYEKVRAATLAASGGSGDASSVAAHGSDLSASQSARSGKPPSRDVPVPIDPRLGTAVPTGTRHDPVTGRGAVYGTHFHALMERLTGAGSPERSVVQRELGLGDHEFVPLWDQARGLLGRAALARFFDSRQHRRALNEVSYVAESGEVRRIDRLVEFESEVWVLDYKTGESPADTLLADQYRTQIGEYCAAVRAVYPGTPVRGLIVFSGGQLMEV